MADKQLRQQARSWVLGYLNSDCNPGTTAFDADEALAEAWLAGAAHRDSQPGLIEALDAVLATLDEADVPVVMRVVHARNALLRLRHKISAASTPSPGRPGTGHG
jgi:hypothetical protein